MLDLRRDDAFEAAFRQLLQYEVDAVSRVERECACVFFLRQADEVEHRGTCFGDDIIHFFAPSVFYASGASIVLGKIIRLCVDDLLRPQCLASRIKINIPPVEIVEIHRCSIAQATGDCTQVKNTESKNTEPIYVSNFSVDSSVDSRRYRLD